MGKINYETIHGSQCLTPCPFGSGKIVGGYRCQRCENFMSRNREEKWVDCKVLKDEFVLPEKWFVLWEGERQFEIIRAFYGKIWGYVENAGYYNIDLEESSRNYSHNYVSQNGTVPIPKLLKNDYTQITFDEWVEHVYNKQELKELPDFYAVECDNKEQTNIVANVFKDYIKNDWNHFKYVLNKTSKSSDNTNAILWNDLSHLDPKPTIIPFELWQKLYKPNKKENMKEIIGYKLKESCKNYNQAALGIVNEKTPVRNPRSLNFYKDVFATSTNFYNAFKEAGVLDLWFEPVYKEETITMTFGDVEFKIDSSGKFAETKYGKVTFEEIEKVFDALNALQKTGLIRYHLEIPETLIFGCKTGKTNKLEGIYKKMKELQTNKN